MAGSPHSAGTHLPIGDLKLNFTYPEGELSDYHHELDLTTATNTVTYKVGDTEYTRQCIASNPDDVIAMHIKPAVRNPSQWNWNCNHSGMRKS